MGNLGIYLSPQKWYIEYRLPQGNVMKKLLYILYAAIGLVGLFVLTNVGINIYERAYKNIDYNQLKSYCVNNNLSTNYAIVVDFSIPSGKSRFFLCDLRNNKIVASSLCAHGTGKGSTMSKPVFSNVKGSKCSSIGHYAIKNRHVMKSTGLSSFKLDGLDSTNSNAMSRGVLIHSSKVVTLFSLGIFPFYLPLDSRISSGCFAVDVDMMDLLGVVVSNEKKPILLYAY